MVEVPAPGIGRRISVVLPAYNEEENIAKQVAVRAKDRVRVVKMDAEKKQ